MHPGRFQPVLRRPAAMPFMVTSRARSRRSSASPARRRLSSSTCTRLIGIDVRVAHVDRAPQHRVVGDQLAVARHRQHGVDRARQPRAQLVAERLQIGGDEHADRSAAAMRGVGLGQHHLDQVDGRAEERPVLIHARGSSRARRAPAPRRAPSSTPSHEASSSRVCVQANCHGIARSDSTPAGAAGPARRPAADVEQRQLGLRASAPEVLDETRMVVDELRDTPFCESTRQRLHARAPLRRAAAAPAPGVASSVAVV